MSHVLNSNRPLRRALPAGPSVGDHLLSRALYLEAKITHFDGGNGDSETFVDYEVHGTLTADDALNSLVALLHHLRQRREGGAQ